MKNTGKRKKAGTWKKFASINQSINQSLSQSLSQSANRSVNPTIMNKPCFLWLHSPKKNNLVSWNYRYAIDRSIPSLDYGKGCKYISVQYNTALVLMFGFGNGFSHIVQCETGHTVKSTRSHVPFCWWCLQIVLAVSSGNKWNKLEMMKQGLSKSISILVG